MHIQMGLLWVIWVSFTGWVGFGFRIVGVQKMALLLLSLIAFFVCLQVGLWMGFGV